MKKTPTVFLSNQLCGKVSERRGQTNNNKINVTVSPRSFQSSFWMWTQTKDFTEGINISIKFSAGRAVPNICGWTRCNKILLSLLLVENKPQWWTRDVWGHHVWAGSHDEFILKRRHLTRFCSLEGLLESNRTRTKSLKPTTNQTMTPIRNY